MKKRFGLYAAWWIALFALFNAIAFISVGWAAYEKYTASFWIGYVLISLAFVGQLVCAYVSLKENDSKKLFYRISLLRISYIGLIVSFLFGSLCMIVSPLPYWIGILVCGVMLIMCIISVLKAAAAISEVERIDIKVKQQTLFIKTLTVDAGSLLARAKSDAVRAECKKIVDSVRYSDPMSSEMLALVEKQITLKFEDLTNAVIADDVLVVSAVAAELQILIKDRNNKCKQLK